ncbi:MAG: peptidoglycan DD-metalloendopeptidase family protein [Dehalococcoidia bacterium]
MPDVGYSAVAPAAGDPTDLPSAIAAVISLAETVESTSASASVEQEPLPVFYEYEVQPGDTASQIAERFGIATDYVLWNNVDIIDDVDTLTIGARLQIPSVEGIIHSARVGDIVSALAVEYDSSSAAIVEFEANGFAGDADSLPVGALILIPGGRRVPPPLPEPTPATESESTGSADAPAPPSAAPGAGWLWPAVGRITNAFSPTHPLGIDISMVVNTPIAAVGSGQVTFVGGNPCCSYGIHVIIDHGNGFESLYAHISQAFVSSGQWVSAGEIIAGSGNTGYTTGPHLHFEIRKDRTHVNPLLYLP